MKKYAIVLVVVSSLVMSSCSVYTCPTYTKKATDESSKISNKEVKI